MAGGIFALYFFCEQKQTQWHWRMELTADNSRSSQRYNYRTFRHNRLESRLISGMQLVRKDILAHLPVIGEYFIKEIAPEDNPF